MTIRSCTRRRPRRWTSCTAMGRRPGPANPGGRRSGCGHQLPDDPARHRNRPARHHRNRGSHPVALHDRRDPDRHDHQSRDPRQRRSRHWTATAWSSTDCRVTSMPTATSPAAPATGVTGNITATGSIDDSIDPGGLKAGGMPPIPVPAIKAADFRHLGELQADERRRAFTSRTQRRRRLDCLRRHGGGNCLPDRLDLQRRRVERIGIDAGVTIAGQQGDLLRGRQRDTARHRQVAPASRTSRSSPKARSRSPATASSRPGTTRRSSS